MMNCLLLILFRHIRIGWSGKYCLWLNLELLLGRASMLVCSVAFVVLPGRWLFFQEAVFDPQDMNPNIEHN